MKTLTGSEKQIQWAEEIRPRIISEIDAFVAFSTAKFETLNEDQKISASKSFEMINIIAEEMKNQTSASWWINCRNATGEALVRNAVVDRMKK